MRTKAVPPISELIRTRPDRWLGQPVVWRTSEPPTVVFIDEVSVGDASRSAFLFGTKYDLAEAVVGGQDYGPGHFAEYFVVVDASGKWESHRLIQNGSVTYSDREVRKDYVPASEVGPRPGRKPKWKASEAVWPMCDGKPMRFVGQVMLDEARFQNRSIMTGITIFLFEREDGEDCFKIVTQNLSAQTAEEHYREELALEKRRRRAEPPKRRLD